MKRRQDFFSLPISGSVSLCEPAIVLFYDVFQQETVEFHSWCKKRCDIQKLDEFPSAVKK